MNPEGFARLMRFVPQTFTEALSLYPWIDGLTEPHEWDNRTTLENASWLIERLLSREELWAQGLM